LAKAARAPAKPKPKEAEPEPEEVLAKPAKSAKPPKEKDKKVATKVRGPFVVQAREEEYDLVSRETCSCGGGFEIEMEEVRPASETAGPLDVLKTLCTECGSHVDFLFDISSFFDGGQEGFEAEAGNGPGSESDDDDEGGWL